MRSAAIGRHSPVWRCAVPLAATGIAAACLALLPAPAAAQPPCTIKGTPGSDVLRGASGPDVICGGGGRDKLFGRGADDRLLGGQGDDRLVGGPGNDILLGGPGDDRLVGGAGDDRLLGGRGLDTLDGGSGENQCVKQRSRTGHGCATGQLPGGLIPISPPSPPAPGLTPPCGACWDTTVPNFDDLDVSPDYVDTSQGDAQLHFDVDAWDPQSDIASVVLRIEGPQGLWRNVVIAGSERPTSWGSLQHAEPVPADTPAGDYAITAVTVRDLGGNRLELDAADLAQSGSKSDFVVGNEPESGGPELADFSIEPTSVDTSVGPASVNWSLEATDALSGVKGICVFFDPPNGGIWHRAPVDSNDCPRPAHGSLHDGLTSGTYRLPQWAAPGAYRIYQIWLYDWAGNLSIYDPARLATEGFPNQFSEDGPGDTTGPTYLDLTHSPDVLHTAAGDRTVTFTVHVTDDLSGIAAGTDRYRSFVAVGIEFPGSPSSYSYDASDPIRVSGSDNDAIWSISITLPTDAPTGTYRVRYLNAGDRAGNTSLLRQEEGIGSRGWDLTFENEP